MNRVVREGFTEVIFKPTLEEGEGESGKAPQEEGIAGTERSIIFHEVLVTTKVYARIVCPIRYEWVRDLLPKLHEFNAHDLSSVARREMREDARRRWTNKENVKHLKGE